MLEECKLPYHVEYVDITKGDQFEEDFLKIAPNNRMPAITDPDGPDGAPISIFESGAILAYLGRKTGQFYPADERARTEVDQWLFWQMGGLGPMAGQAHHFRNYAQQIEPDPEKLVYGKDRYTNEVNRLYGVLERGLADGRDYIAGEYSIADMAIWPWLLPEHQGQDIEDFPKLKAYIERIGERPAVQRGRAVGKDQRGDLGANNEDAEKARAVLFGQKATKSG